MNALSPISLDVLTPLPVWVAWQVQRRKATDPKPTKIPYGKNRQWAKAGVASTWVTRSEAQAIESALEKPHGVGGVGIQMHDLKDGRRIGGVDLDTCIDPLTGEMEPWAREVVVALDSYTETSPSGTGVKVFFTYATDDLARLREEMSGISGKENWSKEFSRSTGNDHPPAIELHLGNRYFAVTGEITDDSPTEFRQVETDLLLDLLTNVGPRFAGTDKAAEEPQRKTNTRKRGITGNDVSRSAVAMKMGRQLVREGADFDKMVEGMLANEHSAEWTREKGLPNGKRELVRIWEKVQPNGPLIRVAAGTLHITTTEAEDALITSGLPVYQRGDTLVRPVTRDVPASRGRTVTAAALGELNVHSMVDMLCGVAEWEKYDGRVEDWVRINPPAQVAQVLLSRNGYWRLPSVAGIITTPTLRADGSLLTAPGYDAATRLFHAADPTLKLHQAVHSPTRAAAEGALKALEALLSEFPFVTLKVDKVEHQVAKAVALSAMITPIVRGAMPVAPLHAFNAHAPGSGTSYLVDVVSMIGAGRPCPVITAAPDEGETEKRIAGLLLAGYPIVSLDNCNGELGGDLLCQAIERPLIRIRRLGASDIIEVESCVSMFATGNNLRVRGDMVRRVLVAELDPEMERPELREFKQDPVATIEADRGRYVSAALVIVRAYLTAGCPDKMPPIASFEAWSDLVRSALVWLGCADPCLSMEKARDDDPELGELREVMSAWQEAIGSDEVTVRQAADIATSRAKINEHGDPDPYGPSEPRNPIFADLLLRIGGVRGVIDTNRLGRWVLSKQGRVVGGFRFKKTGDTGGASRWKLDRLGR